MCKNNPCQNGGSCTELDSGFQCSCLPGYRGRKCQGKFKVILSSYCSYFVRKANFCNLFVRVLIYVFVTARLVSCVLLLGSELSFSDAIPTNWFVIF